MKNIVIASSNNHKVSEISSHIEPFFDKILSLKDFPKIGEIIENGNSIEENSFIKSRASFNYTKLASVADDTILEVDHLNGDPGLYTARYAGEHATYEQNMQKLLKNLKGVPKKMRTARFRTIISYVDNVNDFFVEGVCEGEILKKKTGNNGFGYDPIFFSSEFNMSLAQMNSVQKNNISHRGLALKNFISKIREINK